MYAFFLDFDDLESSVPKNVGALNYTKAGTQFCFFFPSQQPRITCVYLKIIRTYLCMRVSIYVYLSYCCRSWNQYKMHM